MAFPTSVTQNIQANALSKYGISPDRLLLTATHTHNGPILKDQPNLYITYNIATNSANEQLVLDYTRAFENKIDNLLSQLISTQTIEVSGSFAYEVSNLGNNRSSIRPSLNDGTIPVLTLRSIETQKIIAIIFSYTMHAVSYGSPNVWNPDYPGATISSIEPQLASNNPGVRALFLPGTGGDQNPSPQLTPTSIAQILTPKVIAAAAGNSGTGSFNILSPSSSAYRDIRLPLDLRVPINPTMLNRYFSITATSSSTFQKRHAQTMLNQINDGTIRQSMTVRVTSWIFSTNLNNKPLLLIAISGEPTVDFSIGFDKILGEDFRTWTIGYTNGHPGYIPSDEVLARGNGCPVFDCFYHGYESGWDTVENAQRYPSENSGITYNDGLAAPISAGADITICQSVIAMIGSNNDCTNFTPGRLISHPALQSTGPSITNWIDKYGKPHLEIFALGVDGCLHHRAWTGSANGNIPGTWSD